MKLPLTRRDVLRGTGAGLVAAGFGVTVPGSAGAQATNSTEIATAQELQDISADLAGAYVLTADIDASSIANFEPLGDGDDPFTGTFDGAGYTISGLTIDRPDERAVGLFGSVAGVTTETAGVVRNVTLDGVDVTGDAAVAGLIAGNGGNVSDVTVSGTVDGTRRVGGVAGWHNGCLWNAESSCQVSSEEQAGGLVGTSDGYVTDSVATGDVESISHAGGLVGIVGDNGAGYVAASSASGEVIGTGQVSTQIGGLVGTLGGTVADCSASGTPSGSDHVGPLVGYSTGVVLTSSVPGTEPADLVGENRGDIVTADAPTLGGNDRTSWWFQTDTGDRVSGAPTVVDGTVYFGNRPGNGGGCEPTLYALDAASGDQQWTLDTDEGGTKLDRSTERNESYVGKSAPEVVDGTVYVKLRFPFPGIIVAVDAASGQEQWRTELSDGGNLGGPTLYDGVLFAKGAETLHWLDPETGDELRVRGQLDTIGTSVTAAHGQVYVYEGIDGGLAAVDTDTGDINWRYTDAYRPYRFSSPTVARETVYATGSDGTLYAVDAASGDQQWTTDLTLQGSPDVPRATPTVADGTVYVGTRNGTLYAVDAASGDEQWTYAPDPRRAMDASPTVVGDTVFVGSDGPPGEGLLHAVDTTSGDANWTMSTRGAVTSAPTAVDGILYFGTVDGFLYAVDTGGSASSADSRVNLRTQGHVGSSAPPTEELAAGNDPTDPSTPSGPDDPTPTPSDPNSPTPGTTAPSPETATPTPETDDTTAGSSGPGPGVVGTVGSLLGAGYLLDRYTDTDDGE